MVRHWVLKLVVFLTVIVSVPVRSGLAAPVLQNDLIELVYGQTIDGQLDTTQPSVFYTFNASGGDVVTVTMIATGGSIDPFLVLNDAAQSPLATDDNSGGEGNARLTFVIPADGRYIIQATNSGGIPPADGGTFSLNLTAAVDGETVIEPTPETVVTEVPASVPTETAPPDAESDAAPDTGTAAQTANEPVVQGDSTRLIALESGETVRDTLDRQTAVRYYWFEAGTGDQVTVTPEQAAAFKPLIVLYNGNFEEQQRVAPGIGMQAALRSSGVFFLAVSLPDTGSAGGEYGFVFGLSENLAANANFTPVTYGESVQGTIDATTPSVTYTLQGAAGDTITVVMSRASGDLDSYLYLLDENGQLLFEDNDSGGEDGNARMVYTLPVDGTYLITATRLGQAQGTTSGNFLLDVISNAAQPPVAAGAEEATPEPMPTLPPDYAAFPQIAYGETVEGELSDAKFMDIYVFYGEEGDTITAAMVSQNKGEFNALDPLLVLLDDARIPLAEHDDIVDGVERDSLLEYTLERTGYYAVVATRFDQDSGDSAGPYTLTLTGPAGSNSQGNTADEVVNLPNVSDESLVGELETVRLVPGTPAQATFSGGADLYVFPASAGSLVDLSVTADAGLDTIVILADKNLNEVVSSGAGALTGVTLANTGQYVVLVAPRFGPVDASGGYIVALTQTQGEVAAAAPDDETGDEADNDSGVEPEIIEGTTPIVYGDTVRGAINDQQVSRLYSFTGAAGDRVQITLEAAPGSELDTYLELQNANGDVIDANDDINPGVIRDSQIVTVLPADGNYTVVVSRYVGPDAPLTEGEYELTLQLESENAVEGVSTGTVPINYDQTLVGEISDDQYLLFYVFNGTAGDVITIEVDVLTGTLDPVLHLYQSVGDQWIEIANNDDAPTGGTYAPLLSGIILPQTGKYLIAVNRYGLERENTVGTFAITLTRES
jgi:hypothetical protein